MEKKRDMVNKHGHLVSLRVMFTRVTGKMVNKMVKGHTIGIMEINMSVIGKMVKKMGMAHIH